MKVALVAPLTGGSAAIGQSLMRGAEVAIAGINESGGLHGERLSLVVRDDECNPRKAVQVAKELISKEQVAFVIGHPCSAASIAAAEVYGATNTLYFSTWSMAPEVTAQRNRSVFRVVPSADVHADVAANLLRKRFRGANVAILHDGSNDAVAASTEVTRRLQSSGNLTSSMLRSSGDLPQTVAELQSSRAAALYVVGREVDTVRLVREISAHGMNIPVFAHPSAAPVDFSALAASVPVFRFSGPSLPSKFSGGQTYLEKTQGVDPISHSAGFYAFSAIDIFARASLVAESSGVAEVASALRAGSFDSILGHISFNDRGEISPPPISWLMAGGGVSGIRECTSVDPDW